LRENGEEKEEEKGDVGKEEDGWEHELQELLLGSSEP